MPSKTRSARPAAASAAAPSAASAAAPSAAATAPARKRPRRPSASVDEAVPGAAAASEADAVGAASSVATANAKPRAAKTAQAANAAQSGKAPKAAKAAKADPAAATAQAAKADKSTQAAAAAPAARKPRSTRARSAAVPPVAPAVDTAALATQTPSPGVATAPAAEIESPADGSVFGRHAVRVPGEEAAEVWLRSPHPGTAVCTCLDFALSEHADCPHVQALRAHLQADAGRAAALARGPQAVGSRLALLHGARRRLLWLPGTECPPSLIQLAEQWLGVPPDALDDQAVPTLLRAARDAGHALQVDEAVWAHLAAGRDARWRVQRLQALFPEGPADAALQRLGAAAGPPLLPLQVEAALFAVCAGRCILADAPALQPAQQALAAALLMQRHFGVERVLLLAPGEALDRWRRALPDDAVGWNLTSIDKVATDIGLHRSLAPDLVIVQEDAAGGLWVDPDRAAALLRLHSRHAMVLPAADWLQRPAELPLRVAFVDADRQGGYQALLQAHGERDAQGELCGLLALDGVRDTLAPLLLARTLDEVRGQLPERIDQVRRVPMPAGQHAAHAAQAQALADAVARWQRLGWLPDAQQRGLVEQVQALRRLCAGDGAPAVAQAKADALRELLDGGDEPVPKAVAFGQWPAALQAVQAHLSACGVDAAIWSAADPEAVRQAAVHRLQSDAACRVLLVADAGSSLLELRCPGAQVVHLDRPWNPRLLSRRFGRVHRRGKAHLVPVTQLLLEGSFEDAALAVLAERREPPVADVLDAHAGDGFLPGEGGMQWLADLAAVLLACGHGAPPAENPAAA